MAAVTVNGRRRPDPRGENYKWIALSNCTLGVLLATLDASITLIAMPDIFRGIKLDPLVPGNSFYLLWMIFGFLIVTSVLIVSLGRLGDMYGRVRIYNLGFVIYTAASLLLTIDWLDGRAGATYLIVWRIVQGIGAACLLANSAAIITDAFPANQRGMALGINNIVGVSGMFVGLVLGGILAPINWRLVFLISVPVGLFGTLSTFLSAVARGGLMFMLIIWLQGIWLPQHGYDFNQTPLYAGIYMLPLTFGMLLAGPTSGYLSDRFGARGFATGGMVACAVAFALLMLLPTNFS